MTDGMPELNKPIAATTGRRERKRGEGAPNPPWLKEGWRPMNGVMTELDCCRYEAFVSYQHKLQMSTEEERQKMMSMNDFVRYLVATTNPSHQQPHKPIVFPSEENNNKHPNDVTASTSGTKIKKRKRESDDDDGDDNNNNKYKKKKKNKKKAKAGEKKKKKKDKKRNKK